MIKITDGLGNQMFQYAYARSLCARLSQRVYLDVSDINNIQEDGPRKINLNDRREYRLDNFKITLPTMDPKGSKDRYKAINGRSRFLRYCRELRLSPTVFLDESECKESGFRYTRYQDYYVKGYFFDKDHYEDSADILRQEFRLKERLHIPEWIGQTLKSRNTISLHIRRGDFIRLGKSICEEDYYDRAIKYLKDRIEDPVLFIFSDDIEWVRNGKKFDLEHLFISGQGFNDCEELTLMSMCQNHIIANSTYSYWGAWLDGSEKKMVVAPRGWRQKIIPGSWTLL